MDESTILAQIRERLEGGASVWRTADAMLRAGETGLSMTTLLHHARSIQREIWIERGVSTTALIEQVETHGVVTVPKAIAAEIRRMMKEADIGFEELVTFRRTDGKS